MPPDRSVLAPGGAAERPLLRVLPAFGGAVVVPVASPPAAGEGLAVSVDSSDLPHPVIRTALRVKSSAAIAKRFKFFIFIFDSSNGSKRSHTYRIENR